MSRGYVIEIMPVEYFPTTSTYADFWFDYLTCHKPCLFSSNLTKHWRSVREWTTGNGRPNFEHLIEHFGNSAVPVVECSSSANVHYDAGEHRSMTLREFCLSDEQGLYLKDWHFQKEFPEYIAYSVPVFFQSDWLNEYWDRKADAIEQDYRFVYIGKAGTWTPLHADVFRSHSWSANICGRKRWYLLSPGLENKVMFHEATGSLITDVRRYTDEQLMLAGVEIIDQQAGEVIFVPTGWHHQVHNLEDAVSINHNWVNVSNVNQFWQYVQESLRNVEKEIADCKHSLGEEAWSKQCQVVLKADIGIDTTEWFTLLRTITKTRLKQWEQFKIDKPRICSDLRWCEQCNQDIKCCASFMRCCRTKVSCGDCTCSNITGSFQLCEWCCMLFCMVDLSLLQKFCNELDANSAEREFVQDSFFSFD